MFTFLKGLELFDALSSIGVSLVFSFFQKVEVFLFEKLIATAAIGALTISVFFYLNWLWRHEGRPLQKSQILL